MKKAISRRAAFKKITGLWALAIAQRSFGLFGFFKNKDNELEPDASGRVKLSLKNVSYQQLMNNGSSVKVEIKGLGKPLILIRKNKDSVLAISSKCTHLGCEVSLPHNGIINCSCHGAEFKPDGTVVKGPAKQNLKKFRTEVDNKEITIFLK
ncbi:MAG: Rieske (2Fe-2S) protein [Deltaproteobacteria bacterium]|nr:Rieske (2Fe-2S) protein [Deltaproteobacteria bacterium]